MALPAPTGTKDTLGKSSSRTVTDTVIGEHEHTIVGYSLVKGIGDGEPIASERFSVGGHEWVLLFYPDGKRSSSSDTHVNPAGIPGVHMPPAAPPANPQNAPPPNALAPQQPPPGPVPQALPGPNQPQNPQNGAPRPPQMAPGQPNGAPAVMGYPRQPAPQLPPPQALGPLVQHGQMPPRREATNEYAALFVALIGESDNPQGVVNTGEGRVVRAFHRFTLVDQSQRGLGDLTKGRRRDQGAVKISCARQDPNARNCHGYRKFVKRSVLEHGQNGYIQNDTIVIRYTIELVVSTGGALSRTMAGPPPRPNLIQVPDPSLGRELSQLLESGAGADVTFKVEDEELKAHRIVLTARSPMFAALLNSPMREGEEGVVTFPDVRVPVFRGVLHFVYTDSLPEDLDGTNLDAAMAQHLLVAADRFALPRLRRICERRLCETVEVETVATTLALAEQNHGEELKRVCLEFVSRHLQQVMGSEGYQHMVTSCPQLQAELLRTIAVASNERAQHNRTRHHTGVHQRDHPDPAATDDVARRVRQRRE
ncbi:hypothetical protein WJX74_000792 [Apatococcus lobatus]|uniref:BTB domain-containing protein n=2 Tax=Apatococcus TaxID=904362 RepID=A0AAW1T4S4_9CHLO